jgi:hypothetical protein
MKSIILTTLTALALLTTPPARAWTYSDGDVLLVFRKGSQNIEFDLGSVTNFLGKTNGYTTTVTGWSLSLVTGTFGTLDSNVKVVLLATTTTGSTNWLSSAEPNTTAYNVSTAEADTLRGVISAVGTRPLYPIAIPTAGANAYSIDTGGQYAGSSYDSVVSGGHFSGIAKLGGNAPFTVEQAIAGFLDFWSIKSTDIYPNSPPDKLIGTFTITTNGVLTFVAGPRSSTITSVGRSSVVSTVKFTTTVGNTYSVAYTNKLGGAVATWPVDATTLVGDGKVNTINHTSSGNAEFYRVNAQ